MSNLCFDCKNARADLCEKIRSRKATPIKDCKNFEIDSKRLYCKDILKILRTSTKTYYKKRRELGDKWVISALKGKGVIAFLENDETNKVRFFERL